MAVSKLAVINRPLSAPGAVHILNPAAPDYPLIYLPLDGGHFVSGGKTRITNRYGQHAVFTRSSKRTLLNGTEVSTGVPGWEADGLWIEEGTTNLLTVNQASAETDLSGLIPFGDITLQRTSEKAWHGSYSIKVTGNGAGWDGVSTTSISVAPNTTYTLSAYFLADSSTWVFLRAEERDSADALILGTNTPLVSGNNAWQRITLTITTGASTAKLRLAVSMSNSTSTFYADGLQIEQKSYPTSWQDPAVARAAESSEVRLPYLVPLDEGTILVKMVLGDFRIARNILNCLASYGRGLEFYSRTTAPFAIFRFGVAGTFTLSVNGPSSLSTGVHVFGATWSASLGIAKMFVDTEGPFVGRGTIPLTAPTSIVNLSSLSWNVTARPNTRKSLVVWLRRMASDYEMKSWAEAILQGRQIF